MKVAATIILIGFVFATVVLGWMVIPVIINSDPGAISLLIGFLLMSFITSRLAVDYFRERKQ